LLQEEIETYYLFVCSSIRINEKIIILVINKQDSFERNRNLFYVACSRPKKNLTLLFTQELSGYALATLEGWFGDEHVLAFDPG
jgi:superfamily I DNA/RNA helicase